jgi:thiamine-phosphate pyrophosphorylase
MSKGVVDFRLYLITDRKLFGSSDEMLEAIEKALDGGVRAVQLREKDLAVRELLDLSYKMRKLTSAYNARLFINDRVDVALAIGADGVHLGGHSIPASAAKKASAGRLMIGVSCHGLDEALAAEKVGADLITLGPVYETPSKMRYGRPIGLEIFRDVKASIGIPVFAIGGIRTGNAEEVMKRGADGVALISAILAADDIKNTTEEFMRKLK